jgi:hypothetical protein
LRPPGSWGPKEFAQFTEDELHDTMMGAQPGSNYFEWAKAELDHRDRGRTQKSTGTSSSDKANRLLRAIYDRTNNQTSPVDDITTLNTGLIAEEALAALRYLTEKGLVQTFSSPNAARISALGIDVVEGQSEAQTADAEKTVFISYRRNAVPWAQFIFQDLTGHGYDVFFDFQGLASGGFEEVIFENIKARAHFVVLLTPSALERCLDPNDLFRREVEAALSSQRNIVPILLEGFDFSAPGVNGQLGESLKPLKK